MIIFSDCHKMFHKTCVIPPLCSCFQIQQLESEYDAEQRRHAETQKNARKADRRLKELAFQVEEDRKNQERMQVLIENLQGKLKTYKRQAEDAVS